MRQFSSDIVGQPIFFSQSDSSIKTDFQKFLFSFLVHPQGFNSIKQTRLVDSNLTENVDFLKVKLKLLATISKNC